MRRLVLAPRGNLLIDLMIDQPVIVRVDTPLEDLEALFDRVDYSAVPTLAEGNRLVAVVERAAVEEALSEQANEDLLKVGGHHWRRRASLDALAFSGPTPVGVPDAHSLPVAGLGERDR